MEYIKNFWHHECKESGDEWITNDQKKCNNCTVIQPYPFTVNSMKRAYNWFHTAFPSYESDDRCLNEDILLRNDFEEWLIEAGQ